jgi:hypothetical protein
MSLTWHIVRKDLYRLRWVLVLWVVALAARNAFSSVQALMDEEGAYPFSRAAWLFGSVFCPVIAFGLVMALLADDPVAGFDGFWITRPISGGRLLGAKSVLLALLLLPPVLVMAPVWLGHGFGVDQFCSAAGATAKTQAALMALALPFALISPDGTRFVVNVLMAGALILVLGLLYRLCDLGRFVPVSDGVLESRLWVLAWIWVAASIVVACVQFLTRRTRNSVMVLVAGAAAAFAVTILWPWDISGTPPIEVAAQTPEGPKVPGASSSDALANACWRTALGSGQGSSEEVGRIVATLPAQAGMKAARAGSTLRIIEVIDNAPRPEVLVLSLSESAPEFSGRLFSLFLETPRADAGPSEFYFLINRQDGRSLIAHVIHAGEAFTSDSIRYSRTILLFDPGRAWKGDIPPDVHEWIKNATLVKVVAPGQAAPIP